MKDIKASKTMALKPRDTNIELLRILAMLMIVFSHSTFSVINQLKEYPDATNTLLQYLISGGGKIGINLFMLISGYFMCQSSISLKKFVKILIWIYFYDILIGCILFAFGLADLSWQNVADFIFPFRNNGIDHFTTAFLFYYVSIPFWRILVDNLSKKFHLFFILLGYICYVIYNDVPIFSVPLDAVFWFGYLYVIATYIRRYVDIDKYHNTSGLIAILFIGLIYASVFLMFYVIKRYPIGLFCSANSTLALGFSISAFIWFKGLKVKNSGLINLIAASTFGVLLIHSGSAAIQNVVWNKIIHGSDWFFSDVYILYMIISVIALYVACTLIDICYKKFLEKRIVDTAYNFVDECCAHFKSYFRRIIE